jgi:predicted DNA-binding protein (UPF0251 family)
VVSKAKSHRIKVAEAVATGDGFGTRTSVPRPRKRRLLDRAPQPAIYKPADVPLDRLRRVALLQEELEALRLADLEGLTQEQASVRMGVSRSTFQRIVARARRQVALALAEGYALQIEGGTFEVVAPHPRGPRRR